MLSLTRRAALGVMFCAALACAGCKDAETEIMEMDPEVKKIDALISGLTDHAGRQVTWQNYWPEGKAPQGADREKYGNCSFKLNGEPTMSGTTATAKVDVTTEDGTVTTMDWSFVNENGMWKIESGPLP